MSNAMYYMGAVNWFAAGLSIATGLGGVSFYWIFGLFGVSTSSYFIYVYIENKKHGGV